MPIKTVAIIGAGLAGLSLALFLKNQGLDVTIYELRASDATSEGAVMLSPNALRTLDALGIYDDIRSLGYTFRNLHFHTNDGHVPIDAYEMGNAERFGYDALRIYRQSLLDALKRRLAIAGIPIFFGTKFSHIVTEDAENGVRFAFVDGQTRVADLLIGADGIHSTVRKYLDKSVTPSFGGIMAITAKIPTAAIAFPASPAPYPLPVSVHGSAGGFVIAPQNADGSEALVGIQQRTHARDREGWEALARDKAGLRARVRETYGAWNEMVQSAMDAVEPETTSVWAFHTVPTLESWASRPEGRVVLLGDAAHAIPPAAGQGVNQAFEDAHALALVIAVVRKRQSVELDAQAEWLAGVRWWQEYRQGRIQRVEALTNEMNRRRMPGWDGKGDSIDSRWLFDVQIAEDVERWAEANRAQQQS